MTIYFYIAALVCLVIAGGLVAIALNKGKRRSEIAATQTTPVSNVVEGHRVELKGVAKCERPLEAPYSKTPCIHYSYTLKQRERRPPSQSGQRRYRWRTLDSGSNAAPFMLVDDSGAVAVRPDGASFEARTFVDQYVQSGQQEGLQQMESGMLKSALGAAAFLGGMDIRQKVEVRGVAVNEPVYVLGNVQRDAQGNLAVVNGQEPLLISTKSEEELLRAYGRQRLGFLIGAGVLVAIAVGLTIYALTTAA